MFVSDRQIQSVCLCETEMKSVYLGDTELWASFEPFYWIKEKTVTDGFPTSYTTTSNSGGTAWTLNWTITGMTGCGYDANMIMVGETVYVDTCGAKYLDVTPVLGSPNVNVNGKCEIIGIKNGVESTIEIYKDNAWVIMESIPVGMFDSVKLKTTCAHWATNWASFQLDTIYFHN